MSLFRILGLSLLCVATAITATPGLAAQAPESQEATDSSNPPAPAKSLGEVAKQVRKTPAKHANKLFTEDDLEAKRVFPKLNLDGEDNSTEIVSAMLDYKSRHKAEETEEAIHDWFSEYDAMLASSARENSRTQMQRSSTNYRDYWNCQDYPNYENCILRRRLDTLDQHDAQVKIGNNFSAMTRIQQDFQTIRGSLFVNQLNYSWFKIRNSNGDGSY